MKNGDVSNFLPEIAYQKWTVSWAVISRSYGRFRANVSCPSCVLLTSVYSTYINRIRDSLNISQQYIQHLAIHLILHQGWYSSSAAIALEDVDLRERRQGALVLWGSAVPGYSLSWLIVNAPPGWESFTTGENRLQDCATTVSCNTMRVVKKN